MAIKNIELATLHSLARSLSFSEFEQRIKSWFTGNPMTQYSECCLVLSEKPVVRWVKYDFFNKESHPPGHGKYFVCHKDGKVHWETWNGNGWAYNGKSIRFWASIDPPITIDVSRP